MKIFHLSDLHIGKTLASHDLSEEQDHVFMQIISAAEKERPDVIIIAGDVYDKSVPSGESFRIFNDFLTQLSNIEPRIPVLIISGNHDSSLRLDYASSFLEKEKIYISAAPPSDLSEHLKKITVSDEYGDVNFYMLPFTRPADIRNLLGEECTVKTYDEAVKEMLDREEIDFSERNVIAAHQFFVSGVSSPERRDSETCYISVGGIDSVDTSHIERFDYAALGHIHSSQKIGGEHIRYCGAPLKYSVSECNDEKGITVAELGKKGEEPKIRQIPLVMKRDVKKIRGSLNEILSMADDDEKLREDYVSIVLTDEEVLISPKEWLNEKYSHIIDVQLDNTRTNALFRGDGPDSDEEDPALLFAEFFNEINGQPMNEGEQKLMSEIIAEIISDEREQA